MNPSNWDISRAHDSKGGFYNNTMPTGPNEVVIPNRPFSVTYDPVTRQARVFFIVNQNSSIDLAGGNPGATIDPSHLVFRFSGIDAAGRKMDAALLLRALSFASVKHRNQRRKDAESSPYINHLIAVASVLLTECGVADEQLLVAAILHDTVEDTETTFDELAAHFGSAVTADKICNI